ncbi:hypothetical protein SEA_FAUST_70 [Streptomyces phage Faust]|uniref:Uncharacterized protein n=1 Tax=Streptomyces phage Faust TaxID=2767565 RepID=A0A7G9UYR8_9CAUD|nr:hypothetical protein PP456_gp186 [Streptomyces phage Faust]QNN99173.1 hypothetical protein SEA_FAUST_70 [Streptomyces phage Faust]
MSRFFVQREDGIGPGGDIIFRKGHPEYKWYRVFVDDKCFGIIMKDVHSRARWSAVSYAEESDWFATRSMEGFATRLDAATFIIKHHGYWMRDEHRHQRDMARFEHRMIKNRVRAGIEVTEGKF